MLGITHRACNTRELIGVSLKAWIVLGLPRALKAPKDPLSHGWKGALEERLVKQTEQDGLKWSLLKQILKVRNVITWAGEDACAWLLEV